MGKIAGDGGLTYRFPEADCSFVDVFFNAFRSPPVADSGLLHNSKSTLPLVLAFQTPLLLAFLSPPSSGTSLGLELEVVLLALLRSETRLDPSRSSSVKYQRLLNRDLSRNFGVGTTVTAASLGKVLTLELESAVRSRIYLYPWTLTLMRMSCSRGYLPKLKARNVFLSSKLNCGFIIKSDAMTFTQIVHIRRSWAGAVFISSHRS